MPHAQLAPGPLDPPCTCVFFSPARPSCAYPPRAPRMSAPRRSARLHPVLALSQVEPSFASARLPPSALRPPASPPPFASFSPAVSTLSAVPATQPPPPPPQEAFVKVSLENHLPCQALSESGLVGDFCPPPPSLGPAGAAFVGDRDSPTAAADLGSAVISTRGQPARPGSASSASSRLSPVLAPSRPVLRPASAIATSVAVTSMARPGRPSLSRRTSSLEDHPEVSHASSPSPSRSDSPVPASGTAAQHSSRQKQPAGAHSHQGGHAGDPHDGIGSGQDLSAFVL